METLEDKLGSILNNPQMMQQILSMAQTLGAAENDPPPPKPPVREPESTIPPGPEMLQKIAGFAGQSGVSPEEQNLLKALGPYLSRDRVIRLENAMRASKMARLASSFLSSGGLQLLTGG